MSDIDIKATLDTPAISFNKSDKYLLIEGRSILENPIEFYKPLMSELKSCVKSDSGKMEIDFKLEYFNTTSSLAILDMLKLLRNLNTDKNEVVINWYYDEGDDDVLEIGEDFSTIIKFPFNLIANSN